MTSDELRAAERLLANSWDVYGDRPTNDDDEWFALADKITADGAMLARVLLREHRPDDSTVIDEAWLRSAWFVQDESDYWWCCGIALARWESGWRLQVGGTSGMWECLHEPTRGFVRHLATALCIQLKDQST